MHAAFVRVWKGRVKGRDWYDLVWFIRKKTPLNLAFFSLLIESQEILTRTSFLKRAQERIDQLDIPAAIEDIIHFVREQQIIEETWSKDYFYYWLNEIQTTS